MNESGGDFSTGDHRVPLGEEQSVRSRWREALPSTRAPSTTTSRCSSSLAMSPCSGAPRQKLMCFSDQYISEWRQVINIKTTLKPQNIFVNSAFIHSTGWSLFSKYISSSAYPLAGLCALLNNLIEIRR